MNDYTLDWVAPTDDQLAEAWLAAPDRNAVADAAYRVERELRRRPLRVGESRTSSVNRTVFDHPLGVEYEVIEDDKRVRVLRIWLIR